LLVGAFYLQSRQGYDLLGYTQEMAERIKTKWTNPEVSAYTSFYRTLSWILTRVVQLRPFL